MPADCSQELVHSCSAEICPAADVRMGTRAVLLLTSRKGSCVSAVTPTQLPDHLAITAGCLILYNTG